MKTLLKFLGLWAVLLPIFWVLHSAPGWTKVVVFVAAVAVAVGLDVHEHRHTEKESTDACH